MTARYRWIIEDKLAVSPLPTPEEIEELSSVFDGVVVLVMPYELMWQVDDYISKWTSRGVEVYYAPTPDFHPVELLELLRITEWIDEKIRNGSKVLVHCMGGIGRSGLVAGAYLVYKGHNLYTVLDQLRGRLPGAIETIGQRRMLEDYSILIETMGSSLKYLEKIIGIALKAGVSFRHISKSIQFTIELTDYLGLRLSKDLIYASTVHCLHEGSGSSLPDRILQCVDNYRRGVMKGLCETLVFTSHTLDLGMDGRVVVLTHDRIGSVHYVTLLCDRDCTPVLKHIRKPMDLLERVIGEKIVVDAGNYDSYI